MAQLYSRRLMARVLPAVVSAACALWWFPTVQGQGSAPTNEEAAAEARLVRASAHLQSGLVVEGLPVETWPMDRRMEQFSVPGVSVAVIEGGRLAAARAWGVRVAGTAEPVTTETLFQAGSLSKPVTALVALTLVGEGRLDLEGPVNAVLRSWKIPDSELTRATPVTFRHLLSHQAGLTRFGYLVPRGRGAIPAMAELLRGGVNDWPPITVEQEPGSTHAYSNSGYCVLQLALEDAAGTSLHELARKRLFEPLHMSHSRFDEPLEPEVLAAAAAGHTRRRHADGSRAEPATVEGRAQMAPAAAGGLWSTPSDLGRLVEEVLRARRHERSKVLTPELAEAFLTPQAPGEGLGIHLEGSAPALRARHTGGMPGFVAHLVFYPATGQGAVVMSNSDGGSFLNQEIIAAIAAEFDWPGYPVRRRLGTASVAQLRQIVGVYALDVQPDTTFTVRLEGSVATGRINRYPPFPLTATDVADRFVEPSRGLELVFERDDSGLVQSVSLGPAGEAGYRYSRRTPR